MGPSQLKGEEAAWESHEAQIGGKDAGSEEGADFMEPGTFGTSSEPSQVPNHRRPCVGASQARSWSP